MRIYKNKTGYGLIYSEYVLFKYGKIDIINNQILKNNEDVDIELSMSKISVIEDESIKVSEFNQGEYCIIKIDDSEKRAHNLLPKAIDYIKQSKVNDYIDIRKMEQKLSTYYPLTERIMSILEIKGFVGKYEMYKGRKLIKLR